MAAFDILILGWGGCVGGEERGTFEVKLSTLLPLPQTTPPSHQVSSWPAIRIMLKRGKGKAEGPSCGR